MMNDQINLPRPTVLTPEVRAIILESLSLGNYLVTACDVAGISYDTLLYWRKKHDSAAPEAEAFSDFFGSIKRAVALGESAALADLKTGGPGWQSQAWFLERRFPKRWGKQDKVKADAVPRTGKPRIDIPDVHNNADSDDGDPGRSIDSD